MGGDLTDADASVLDVLHPLILRGYQPDLRCDPEEFVQAGLVLHSAVGWMATAQGRERHAGLLDRERSSLDLVALGTIYERFLVANAPFKALTARWQGAVDDERWELVGELEQLVSRVEAALARTTTVLPRFCAYAPRLRGAMAKVEEGDFEWVTSVRLDSLHTVWMEVHEDYLLTLGRSREEEASF